MKIENEDGRIYSLLIGGAVLESEFARQKPLPGERIRLTYCGTKQAETGNFAGKEYHLWRLEVQRAPQVPNWDELAAGEVEMVPAQAPRHVDTDVPIDTIGLPEVTVVDDDIPL